MFAQQPAADGRLEQHFARGGFLEEALRTPSDALAYRVGEELASRYPGRAIIESDDSDFDVEEYADAGLCAFAPREGCHMELSARWDVDEGTILRYHEQGWYRVAWEGCELEVLRLTYSYQDCSKTVRC